jgi:hypothetical protein
MGVEVESTPTVLLSSILAFTLAFQIMTTRQSAVKVAQKRANESQSTFVVYQNASVGADSGRDYFVAESQKFHADPEYLGCDLAETVQPQSQKQEIETHQQLRDRLIALCERAAVPKEKWRNRDSASAQMQLGKGWALLKAGADFQINKQFSNQDVYSLDIWVEGFRFFENGGNEEDRDYESCYIPTEEALAKANGEDWY